MEKAQQKREEDNARREAERKKAALEERNEKKSVVPHAKEIRDCAALLAYLDDLIASSSASAASAAPAVAPVQQRGPKIADDDWGNFATKKGKKNAPAASKTEPKKAKFVINLQSMEQFAKLGFAPPMTLEEVPKVRADVAAKHSALVAKSEAERAEILAKIAVEEAAEAAAEAAAASAAAAAAPGAASAPAVVAVAPAATTK